MKVIIDKNNPCTVEDQDGTVLFDWQPQFEKNIKPLTDEDKKYVIEQLRDKGFNML